MIAGRFGVVCGLLIPAFALAEGQFDVRVTLSENGSKLFELHAKQAPLDQVFDAVENRTGVHVHYPVLPERPVTAACATETVMELMRCLLGSGADLMFRHPDGPVSAEIKAENGELWVLGSSFEEARNAPIGGDSDRDPTAWTQEETAPHADMMSPEEVRRWAKMAQSKDPAERAAAVARLMAAGGTDEAAVRNALEKALSDEAAEVRAQAVFGLAQWGDGVRTSAMLQAALRDDDASVRLIAVSSAGTDAEGQALLQEALADSDETVSAMAAMRLESLANPDDSDPAQ